MKVLMRKSATIAAAPVLLSLTGCGVAQSVLDPKGVQAERIAQLFWFFTAVSGLVWILVTLVLCLAIVRDRGALPAENPLLVDQTLDRRMGVIVGSLAGLTTAILVVFTMSSYLATRGLAASGDAIGIEVTGYQWWWNVKYENRDPSQIFETANELHIPVGRPIRITLKAADVIHSFWVPNLTGKQDLIPGQDNILSFTAKKAGKYRGQCAEFCGWQHAHMAFFVVAESREEFEAWRTSQLNAASAPSEKEAMLGEQIFMMRGCALCHTIRGTTAGGRTGPDLTHVASRLTLAAGTLPNSRENLVEWIADPQKFKPGNKMPKVALKEPELDAVAVYLWKNK
jgi:cytochrome c oxidase subunit 2